MRESHRGTGRGVLRTIGRVALLCSAAAVAWAAPPAAAPNPPAPAPATPAGAKPPTPPLVRGKPTPIAFQCTVEASPKLPARPRCEHGLPVVVGQLLLLPRACRLPLDKAEVDRHTVEFRDARTGRKLGQASLPPGPPVGTAPRVGGILGGPYPVYVFGGGVASVDATARKLELVLQAEGRIAGFARSGEILAVAEALPADKHFGGGSISWTVLDFGAGIELGSLRVAGTELVGLGVEPRSDAGIPVWLRMKGRIGVRDLIATLDPKGAGEGKPAPSITATAVDVRPHADPHGSDLQRSAPVAGRCPAASGRDAVLPDRIAVRYGAGELVHPTDGRLMMAAPGCLVATWPDDDGAAWALLADKPDEAPTLGRLRCQRGGDAKVK
ncbi:MAG: hypothetical protein RIT45_4153 [Pseudomonadota bacterium]